MVEHLPEPEYSAAHYRDPKYVISPVNATFIGWLLLLGVPLLMLFLIYARQQSTALDNIPAISRRAERIEILPGADNGNDAGVTMGQDN